MTDKERFSVSFYKIIVCIKDAFTLPTHNTVEQTLILSAILFGCTTLSTLLGFYTFISWQGALICTVFHVVLLYKERSENDALLRMYRNARVSAEKVMQRAKSASTSISGERRTNSNRTSKQKTGKRK